MRFNVWWSLYLRAGSRQSAIDGPLRAIADSLGVQLELMSANDPSPRQGIQHIDARFSLDAPSCENANGFALRHAQKLGGPWFGFAWLGGDPDERHAEQTCSLYVRECVALDVPEIVSAGVKVNWVAEPRENRLRTPPIKLKRHTGAVADFELAFAVEVQASSKAKLMSGHWPKLQAQFGEDAKLVDVKSGEGGKGPFRLNIIRKLLGVTSDDAATRCLGQIGGKEFVAKYESSGELSELRMVGQVWPERGLITDFSLRKIDRALEIS